MKPDAFVLTGSFLVICRAPLYLQELSRRGLTILVVTPSVWREQALVQTADPDHPASAITEVAFVDGDVNTENSFTAGVISSVRDWRERYAIRGVYAVGETLVEPTGLLADALGLPSPGLRATRACRSKYLQRWYLPEFSPASTVVPPARRRSFDADAVRYPVVVKPTGRHSSSGVETVADAAELRAQFGSYLPHETVLVEEKVAGQEFSVESLVQDGRLFFASVTRKETTESGTRCFVELAHSVPNDIEGVDDVILDANRRMLEALAFRNGIAHAEWRVDASGRPYLMEVAARTPGDGLSILYLLATGVPLEPAIVRIALGEPADYPAPRRYARQVYLEHEPGLLADVTVDWPGIVPQWVGEGGLWPEIEPGAPGDPPALRAVLVTKDPGDLLGPLHSSDDRAVSFLIDAPTAAELDELELRVRQAVRVHTLSPAEPAGARM
ncbi:ATP-grasp domain-containing protein [Microbispora sp. ATCC PTA-5024]|uniref:ATP-grasp domain-containing protein n=1 Tax=Microbispora sp. ATCC PTA-5024 TaxID=316330 RepID=UPI0003DC24C4|nr:ATP-grasp domain-containing protein [Microbispora sp. ATCC PTA-5024]ETK35465.1 carboxylase [Microbispora sp. ATCC PTA-5024]